MSKLVKFAKFIYHDTMGDPDQAFSPRWWKDTLTSKKHRFNYSWKSNVGYNKDAPKAITNNRRKLTHLADILDRKQKTT